MPANEPENFQKEFSVHSKKFAIVDASVLDDMDGPLVDQAIIVPTKYDDTIFSITAEYDDTILRRLVIEPAVDESDPDKLKRRSEVSNPKEIGKGLEPGEDDDSRDHIVDEEKNTGNRKKERLGGVSGGLHGNEASGLHVKVRNSRSDKKEGGERKRRRRGARKVQPLNGIGRRRKGMKRSVVRKDEEEDNRETLPDFIVRMMGKEVSKEQLKTIENKELLSESLAMLMSMTMGGWETKHGKITNGKYVLSEQHWNVRDDGFLADADDLSFDFDWIYDTKRNVDMLIQEERQNNLQTLLEAVDEQSR